MTRYCLIICSIVAIVIAGCTHVEKVPNESVGVPATSATRAFEGIWGANGDEILVIAIKGEAVVISHPEIEEYWVELADAEVEANSIKFVIKYFYLNEEPSPFNGVPCSCTIRLVEPDILEYQFSTELTGVKTEILERMPSKIRPKGPKTKLSR